MNNNNDEQDFYVNNLKINPTPKLKVLYGIGQLHPHRKIQIVLTAKRNSESGCSASIPGFNTAPLRCPNVTVSPGLRSQVSAILMSLMNVPFRLVSEILKACLPVSSLSVRILAWSLEIMTLFLVESKNISEEAGFLPTTVISLLILKINKLEKMQNI